MSTFIQQLLREQSYTEDSFWNENIHHIMTVLLNHLKMACRSERDWRYDNPYSRLPQVRECPEIRYCVHGLNLRGNHHAQMPRLSVEEAGASIF